MFANIAIRRGIERPIRTSQESILETRLATLERLFYAFIRSQSDNGIPSDNLVDAPTGLENHGRDTPILSDAKKAVFKIEAEEISAAEGTLPIETEDHSISAALKTSLADVRIVEQESPSEPAVVGLSPVVIGTQESHVDVQETRPRESTFTEVESIKSAITLSDTAAQLREDRQASLEILETRLVTPVIDLQIPVGSIKELAINQSPLPNTTQSAHIAHDILGVIQNYGQHVHAESTEDSSKSVWLGRSMFMARVERCVDQNQPVKMILPAFPWKSINRVDKVNGCLPDLGEHLALSRLNHLCEDVGKIYPRGAEVTIATDGLVFDDLVGISDEDTWTYSESLMRTVQKSGFKGIKLLRPMDILNLTDGQKMTKEVYFELAAKTRMVLEDEYGQTEEKVREMIQTDEDTLMTYRGFIRFLETDLRHSPVAKTCLSGSQYRKCVKKVAMGMMRRAESFTNLLQAKCQDYVRLSIHPSKGGVKLSIPLIVQPTGEFPRTPWHCTIAVGIDGSYRTVYVKDVQDTHNVIVRNGHPYFYRERSVLWDWDDADVVFEPQYPSGVLIHPSEQAVGIKSLTTTQLERLQRLAKLQSPIIVSGFKNFSADAVHITP